MQGGANKELYAALFLANKPSSAENTLRIDSPESSAVITYTCTRTIYNYNRILYIITIYNYNRIPYSGYFSGGKMFVDMESFAGSRNFFCGYVYACTNGRGSLHLW